MGNAASVFLLLAFMSSGLAAEAQDHAEKLSSELTLALRQLRGVEVPARPARVRTQDGVDSGLGAGVVADTSVLNVDESGRAQLYVRVGPITTALLASLEELGVGVEQRSDSLGLLQVRVSPERVEQLAALAEVQQVRLAEFGFLNAGSVQTEGDALIRADRVRSELSIRGAGIRVGVISDGIEGVATSIFRGDLPSTGVTSRSFRADANLNSGSEGTAMLEIIHDIAPDARLFFANFQTTLEFMAAQNWLADRTDLIVDSVSFFNNGPYNGTSPVSMQTASLIGRGLVYFTAVGNFGDKHHTSLFSDTNGNDFHEFGQPNAAGETLSVTLFPNSNLSVFLQWDDNFGASGNNFDLFLTSPDDPNVVVNNISSRNVQDGNDDPIETLTINYTGDAPVTFGIAIRKVATPQAKRLKLFFAGHRFRVDEFVVPDGSVPNHNDAGGGVLAIGAMDFRSAGSAEPFSSRGPTGDGRLKPDFVAPDGVSTGATNFGTFFGTSAAAAHAAGVGALILSASPNLAPAQVAGFLRAGAVELGALGPDNTFGFGRIDAFMPVDTLVKLPAPTFFSAIDSPSAQSAAVIEAGNLRLISSNFEVSGWAIGSRGIQKVEIVLDGTVVAVATYGWPRQDVCAIFANFPGCPNVGFVAQLSAVAAGTHALALRLTDNTGNVTTQPVPPQTIQVDAPSITAFMDAPDPGASVPRDFTVRGWAVSPLGIRRVEIFLDGLLLREAAYGTPRPDVCAVFPQSLGCPNVGFTGDLTGVSPGNHQLLIRFTDNGGGVLQLTRNVQVVANQVLGAIDVPGAGASTGANIQLSGWGLATQSVLRVEILVDGTFVLNATLGNARADVCAAFPGFPQCPNVGFVANLTGLAAGARTLTARVVDTLGGTTSVSVSITVTGAGQPANVINGSLEGPTAGTVNSPFTASGWAVATLGVQRVEVLLDGAVIGNATFGGIARPDACAVFPGFPGCPNVGFTGSFTATPGAHTVQIRVVDNGGASALFPATPINITVAQPPPPVQVPEGDYFGMTGQARPVFIRVSPVNVIAARNLNMNGLCVETLVGLINLTSATIVNGAFTTAGDVFGDPGVVGTFSLQGTFTASSNTLSGTFSLTLTETPAGPCSIGPVAWSATLSP